MERIPRGKAVKTIGAAGAGALIGGPAIEAALAQPAAAAGAGAAVIIVAGQRAQLVVEPVSQQTIRISVIPASARADRNSIGAASSIACAAALARIACARTADACRCPG